MESLSGHTQTEPTMQSVIDDSLVNFIPSYKEVLNRTPLPIYLGGENLPTSSVKDINC
jgi:hypothetical protein